MPVTAKKNPDSTIAVARVLRRQRLHAPDHWRILGQLPAPVAQRRSRDREQRAGPPRREPTLPAIRHSPPASRQMERNLELLQERAWLDIPLVYNNGRRAILAVEKGDSGRKAFKEAFAKWDRGRAALYH